MNSFYKSFIYVPIQVPEDEYYDKKITRVCYKIVMAPLFNALIMLIIVINTGLLSTDSEPPLS